MPRIAMALPAIKRGLPSSGSNRRLKKAADCMPQERSGVATEALGIEWIMSG